MCIYNLYISVHLGSFRVPPHYASNNAEEGSDLVEKGYENTTTSVGCAWTDKTPPKKNTSGFSTSRGPFIVHNIHVWYIYLSYG